MKTPLFDDFNHIGRAQWMEQLKKDLKDESASEPVAHFPYENISLPAYLTEDPNLVVPRHPATSWKIRAHSGDWNQEHWEGLREGFEEFEVHANQLPDSVIPDARYVIHLDDIAAIHKVLPFIQSMKDLKGHIIHFDPIARALNTGKWKKSAKEDLREIQSLAVDRESCEKCCWIYVDARSYGNAGGSAIQELSYAASHLNEFLHELKEDGFMDAISGGNIEISLSIGGNYLLEIAKFRAARILFQQILEKYNLKESNAFRIHAETNTLHASKMDGDTNLLRHTTAAMSAIIGGCQSISIATHTGFNDIFSNRIARNIPLLLRHEAHIDQGMDNVAGSYFLDTLTLKIANSAWDEFKNLEIQGGLISQIENNAIQKAIDETAQIRINRFKEQKDVMIGVNKYKLSKTSPTKARSSELKGDFQALRPLFLEQHL